MNHFDYRDGVLHAEDVAVADIAAAVGTPFYCYSTATLTRHYNVFAKAFAGTRRAGLLRHEGEFQPGGAAGAGEARRRRRRGLGRRDAPRAGRRHPGEQDPVFRRRQDGAGNGFRACRRHPLLQRRIRAGTGIAVGARRRRWARPRRCRCASIPMSTPRRTGRSRPARPRTSSAFRGSARATSTRGRPNCRASRSPASTCISAARSPICSHSTTPSRCSPSWSARCAPTVTPIEHIDLGGGLGIPYRTDNDPPPLPDAYAAIVKKHVAKLGLKVMFEPGRLIVGNAGILVSRSDLS